MRACVLFSQLARSRPVLFSAMLIIWNARDDCEIERRKQNENDSDGFSCVHRESTQEDSQKRGREKARARERVGRTKDAKDKADGWKDGVPGLLTRPLCADLQVG
eukprot:scaffold2751_cov266-Pinguiococcus_pyrenoidosus.AAC.1